MKRVNERKKFGLTGWAAGCLTVIFALFLSGPGVAGNDDPASGSEFSDTPSAIDLGAIGLEQGFYYHYTSKDDSASSFQDIYITDETASAWKGVAVTVIENKVTFQRFELTKRGLKLVQSENMRKSDLAGPAKLLPGRRGEVIVAFGHLYNHPEENSVFSSREPYILIESRYLKLAEAKPKTFSVSEYNQYRSYPEIPRLGDFEVVSYELKPDGVMDLTLTNRKDRDLRITLVIADGRITRLDRAVPAGARRSIRFPVGQAGSAGQEFKVFVEVRFQDPGGIELSSAAMEFSGVYGLKREYGE